VKSQQPPSVRPARGSGLLSISGLDACDSMVYGTTTSLSPVSAIARPGRNGLTSLGKHAAVGPLVMRSHSCCIEVPRAVPASQLRHVH
jgi:hypothetical protein